MRPGKLSFCVVLMALLMCFMSTAMAAGVVKSGDAGKQVEEVQTLLKEKGYYPEDVSGICDEVTVDAIKAFQRDHHLEVDGICGPITLRRLKAGNLKHDLAHARVMTVSASAYSPQDSGMGTHTASGTPLRRGVIAVDPAVIPMGTTVYIPDYGEAIAEDIGWGIQGHTIDIAFDTHEEAIWFGRQVIEIYILD